MSIESIFNYHLVSPHIATSGQPTKEEFLSIADEEYELVINLASPSSTERLSGEDEIVTELGMSYIHIAVEWEMPRIEQLNEFCAVMQTYTSKKIWVHCIANYRVSAFMLYYLQKYQNYSTKEAASPIFKIWQPNTTWQIFIDTSLGRLD